MRVVAYAITLIAAVATAVLVATTLLKSSTAVPCLSCILSRAVVAIPEPLEGHGSYVLVGLVAVPNVSSIHVRGRELVSYGPSRLPVLKPIIRIELPKAHVPGGKPEKPVQMCKHLAVKLWSPVDAHDVVIRIKPPSNIKCVENGVVLEGYLWLKFDHVEKGFHTYLFRIGKCVGPEQVFLLYEDFCRG